MQYRTTYTYTKTGIEYSMTKLTFWYEFPICPECGKQLQPENGLVVPHVYICQDCYENSPRYRNAVDNEHNLYEYPRQ